MLSGNISWFILKVIQTRLYITDKQSAIFFLMSATISIFQLRLHTFNIYKWICVITLSVQIFMFYLIQTTESYSYKYVCNLLDSLK